jgi:hypothetical protein
LTNPVRFSGYRLLKELGLSYSGENYEDINRWGQRMADTTITSEQVIYLAARKKYANTTVHVFRSFTRAGQSNLDNTGRTDSYEVVLEDWLLENLNQSYVIPEDFNAYRKLKRPTAKGIFGYLHLWFHASRGRQVEKDYAELCVLLNIPAYRHRSKIRDTMGLSLDELIQVGYLSAWDIRPMVTKDGYKLILLPGDELLHVLAISQKKELDGHNAGPTVAKVSQDALNALIERGISPVKANVLAQNHDSQTILDQIEYAEFLMAEDRRRRFDNPAGFIIYTIENSVPVPSRFVTARKRKQQEHEAVAQVEQRSQHLDLEQLYSEWVDSRLDAELQQRFPGEKLEAAVKQIIKRQIVCDDRFGAMVPKQQRNIAIQFLKRDLREELPLPSIEEWRRSTDQLGLFSR